jgi:outer membrane protein TolC
MVRNMIGTGTPLTEERLKDMDDKGACVRGAALGAALLFMLILTVPIEASEAKTLSLEDCISIALKNNPEIGISDANLKRAENGLMQYYGQILPNFSVNFTTGRAFYGPSSIQYDVQGRPVQTEGFDYNSYAFNMYQ